VSWLSRDLADADRRASPLMAFVRAREPPRPG